MSDARPEPAGDRDAAVPVGFERQGEQLVHDGHVIRLLKADFRAPDGEHFERDVIRHPGAVAIVPVDDDGTVTLVRQLRPSVWEAVLEAPAGTRDVTGEPPEVTAGRELVEEAGLAAERIEHLATVYNSPGISDQRTMLFLATGLSPRATARSGVEERFMHVERVKLDDIGSLVSTGQLHDAMTILGMLLARDALAGRR